MSAGKSIITAVANGFKKQWPKIAVGAGASLLIVGGYLLGKEMPKYKKAIEEREKESGEKLSGKEKVKIAVKHFAASAGAITGGSLCLVAAVCESDKRIDAGAAAVAISNVATKNLTDYASAAKEVLGEEGDKKVKKKVKEKKQAERKLSPVPQDADISVLPSNKYPCYDLTFDAAIEEGGKPFSVSINTLRAAEVEVNRRMLAGDEVTMNELYELIDHPLIKIAEAFVFRHDDEHPSYVCNLDIGTMIGDDGIVYLTISPNAKVIKGGKYGIPDYDYYY